MKSSKNIVYMTGISRMNQLPNLKPGEILITAEDNRLLGDEDVMPYMNQFHKDGWITETTTESGYRYCPGGLDMMHAGVTIPLWADLRVRLHPNGIDIQSEFNVDNKNPDSCLGRIHHFEKKQTGDCPFTSRRDSAVSEGQYLKLANPFSFMTPKGYSSILTGSLLHPRPEFDVIPGVVNTDYYHTVNIIINVLTDKEFYIPQGTPIAQMTFFKRSDNVSKMYVGDEAVSRLISERGFGGPIPLLPNWRRGKYRKEQRKWD